MIREDKNLDCTQSLFQQTLENIDHAQDNQSVLRALKSLSETFGLNYIYVTQLVNPLREMPQSWMHIHNWPSELIQERIGSQAHNKDPIVRKAINAYLPFPWKDVWAEADDDGLTILKQAKKYGLAEGWLFPLRSEDLPIGGVSFGGEICTTTPEDVDMLKVAAKRAYARIFVLSSKCKAQPQAKKLSKREAEILTLIAEGCKTVRAAEILGVGPDAVKDSLARCYRKLGAQNRADAVAQALQSGQIFPFTGRHTPIG